MEYLLVMALSGSTMTAVYLLLRYLLKDKLCARLFDPLARVAILYYLIPLPYVKRWYVALMRFLWPDKNAIGISRESLGWRNQIVRAEGSLHVNLFAILQTAAVIVWLLGIGILMARRVAEYVRMVRLAAKYAERAMTPEQRTFLDSLKEQYRIRRRVYLYEAPEEKRTMTFGFFRPVIVCDREVTDAETELLVRHELVHIRRKDAFWKMFMELAAMLHWWNPLVWRLRRDFEQVCECSCDETVMQDRTAEEVKAYLRLMIEEACEKKLEKDVPRWKSGFGDNAQKIKERMENLMSRKKWSRVAAVTLVAALTFANSMTVFAYRDTFERETTEEVSSEEVGEMTHSDTVMFAPKDTDVNLVREFEQTSEAAVPEILYDRQFTDEEGNIYPITEDDGIEPYCNHDFVEGTGLDHIRNSSGGCKIIEYNAQKCSKCGYLIQGKTIRTNTYMPCPH